MRITTSKGDFNYTAIDENITVNCPINNSAILLTGIIEGAQALKGKVPLSYYNNHPVFEKNRWSVGIGVTIDPSFGKKGY